MSKSLFLLLSLCSCLVPVKVIAQPTEESLRRHIEILASDIFQGRAPGTIGEAVASHYIAAQFSQAGLEPGHDGSFYQPVALVERFAESSDLRWHARNTMEGAGGSEPLGPDDLIVMGQNTEMQIDVPIVFAGYASVIGEPGSPLSESDITGAAVILLADVPEDADDIGSFAERRRTLAERGAVGVIGVSMERLEWPVLQALFRERSRARLDHIETLEIEGAIAPDTLRRIMSSNGYDLDDLILQARDSDFRAISELGRLKGSVSSRVHRFNGYNVIARLPGQADTDEAVMFLAHYDHFGVCRPEGAPDRICNGAVDNASGTAAIIEIAQGLAEGPQLGRDVIFVATTAEEQGLLGAQFYVDHPTVSLGSVVGVFNLDTIALGGRGAPAGIVGRGMTPLDDPIDSASMRLSREVFTGLELNNFVNRQDGWAFMANGVPAIMAGGSFVDGELLQGFLDGRYHGPDDEIDEDFEIGGAFEDVLLHIEIGRTLANPQLYSPSNR